VEWVELGRLGAPFGVRGWLHVESFTEPVEGLLEYPVWTLRLASGERVRRELSEGRAHGAGLVVRLAELSDRDAAAALTGAWVEIERAALPKPAKGEFYRSDLLGFAVRNLEGADLGVVSHFVDAPRGAVMVTRDAGGAEHWVLAQPAHLKKVDLAGRTIVVDWPAELE
jgi:16S rRNA processing protein RimM